MLPAGHLALLDLDAELPRAKPYWQLPEIDGEGVEALDALRGELETATRQHLVSDVPVGVFLSGGIDSSAVTALAARAAPGRIATFTIAFDDPAFDESKYARRVSEQLHTDHHEIVLGESAFRAQLDDALACLDQPSFDAINTYFVSRAVREAGITVALAGTGGDELFGGYRSFREIPRGSDVARRAGRIPAPVLRALARIVSRIAMGSGKIVPPQTRWGKLEDALATRGDLVDLYQVSYALFSERFLGELVEPDLRAHVDHGLSGGRRSSLRSAVRGIHGPRAVSTLELSNFLEQRLLRDTDCASMAVSLEVRVPLLDHLVIESVWRLSESRRFEPLGKKQALREAALGGLDPALFEREKSGFVLPIDRWAREGLQEKVAETLNDRAACASVGLVPDAVARLWRGFQAGAPGLYWSRVWSLFVLLRWCAEHRLALSGRAAGLRASA
jgi:asparagine synthase (glutamine-hydrolysing)